MADLNYQTLRGPYSDAVLDDKGIVSRIWQTFFLLIESLLTPLGSEKSATITNDVTVAAAISAMSVSAKQVSHAIVEYLIQRVTTAVGAVELIEAGAFHLVYLPTSEDWSIVPIGTPGPGAGGLTFTVTPDGQVMYESTNEAGTPSISRIIFRIRTMSGKSTQYSSVSVR